MPRRVDPGCKYDEGDGEHSETRERPGTDDGRHRSPDQAGGNSQVPHAIAHLAALYVVRSHGVRLSALIAVTIGLLPPEDSPF
jgi:hypothetical protein